MTEPTPHARAPETHAPTPEAPGAPPPRRRFLLGRLAGAVRRQDWFTVLVEIAVVVLGVVIGFQVTAWGQARSDRAKEQTYLRQLAADLRQTQREAARVDSIITPADRAAAALFHTYSLPVTPPDDSLSQWMIDAYLWEVLYPVTGTAEALVATGDLGLLRDDSLRTAVTAYIERAKVLTGEQDEWVNRYFEAAGFIYDRALALYGALPPAVLDSLVEVRPNSYLPPGPRRPLPPLRPRAVLAEPGTQVGLGRMVMAKNNLRLARDEILTRTAALLTRVEAEIEP